MTKQKSTKRALLMSALALLMCVSMLIGSTFAWFTDSVTSSNNIIQTGTLNIGMYWMEGDEDPATATWTDASSGAIFNNDKWEPGYVEAKHIKIANEGTLALKYKLLIVPNGEVEALADVIDVYYIEGATQLTRDMLATATPVGTLRDLINDTDGAAHGALLPVGETATDTYERVGEVTATIAFKMQESADNDYQGMSIGTDFSIQLFATQYTYEGDSFDNQYDSGAKLPTIVNNAEELSEALNSGGNVILSDNISVSSTLAMNGGILDGNGKTASAAAAAGTGNATINPTGGTIKNLVVEGTGNTRSPYGIGSIQYSNTTLTEDMYIENVDVSKTRMAIDLDANGNDVYVKDCELANMIQIANQEEAVFENCHFYFDKITPAMPGNSTNNIMLLGNMTFINCHFEESINLYVGDRCSGTIKFINCTYGNNGVEDRPFEPTVGFFTWWMEPQGIVGYGGSFGDGDPGRTNFTCIVDDTVVWEATN